MNKYQEARNHLIKVISIAGTFISDTLTTEKAIGVIQEAIYKAEKYDEMTKPKFVKCKGWKGVRNTRCYCPTCGKPVVMLIGFSNKTPQTTCPNCSQRMKYPLLKKSSEGGEYVLDWSDESA